MVTHARLNNSPCHFAKGFGSAGIAKETAGASGCWCGRVRSYVLGVPPSLLSCVPPCCQDAPSFHTILHGSNPNSWAMQGHASDSHDFTSTCLRSSVKFVVELVGWPARFESESRWAAETLTYLVCQITGTRTRVGGWTWIQLALRHNLALVM